MVLSTLISVSPAQAATKHVPVGAIEQVATGTGGIHVAGWALDPSGNSKQAALSVQVSVDGKQVSVVTADQADSAATKSHPELTGNYGFRSVLDATAGKHSVCFTAVNAPFKTTAALGCRPVTVLVNPVGTVHVLARALNAKTLTVSGWAIDPEKAVSVLVVVRVDGAIKAKTYARTLVPGLKAGFAGIGAHHGYAATLAASWAAHKVCVTATNVGRGVDVSLGCITAAAVPGVRPGAPLSVHAAALVQAAQVTWNPPAVKGGTALTYRITTSPATSTVMTSGLSAVVSGLQGGITYRFIVQAHNGLGYSPGATSPAVTVAKISTNVTSPPLISTSRYIRNLHARDAAGNYAKAVAMGATDASHNPGGHAYLILIQFGGQSTSGNTQSATANSSLTYAQTVAAMRGYLDGYHSTQKSGAPVTIAFGTNNDRDVRYTTGKLWAQLVVNPLSSWAHRYSGITVAGANDIEPGFLGSMSQSKSWVQGFLDNTSAKFVFNGSADGCGWTRVHAGCNNGYTAAGIQWMAGGAAPTRILALPQIYNYTQPKQWKFISLTGAVSGLRKVGFAGPLTEYTACHQAHSCGSLSNNNAWTALWNQLKSDARVRPSSLPYGTDLRIN